MPMSSLQVSSMIGGQQVMFANQATYAHQISSQFYGSPAPTSSMQNPFPGVSMGSEGMGSAITSGLGGALPGALGAASMIGGLAGGAAGVIDPFTMVPKAFSMGTGAARGAGVLGTLGHVGSAFATKGVGAGLGVMAGGLGAAALTAAPFIAAGAAASYVGGKIGQGAQDIGAVGEIMGRGGPQYGAPGTRPGGQAGRRQIQAMTGMLHEMQSQDSQLAGQDMVQMLDKAERHGLFSGVTNPQQFQQKFKKMVEQVKNIAQIMGSTIEEAMPFLGNMQRMGLWSAQDVMSTGLAARTAGPQGAQALMGTMQAGAQMSHQRGGTLGAGAIAGRQSFMTVQAAMGSGVLNDQSLREMTGGTGGVEGQRMLATQITGSLQSLSGTPMGRLVMAALGETREGRYTGRMDSDLLSKFQSGQISVDELQALGRRKSSTKEGAASFSARQERLGQDMAAQGGLGGLAAMSRAVLEKSGHADSSSEIQELMLRRMTGMGERESGMTMQLMEGMPQIQEYARKRAESAAENAARELFVKRNRSMEGLQNAAKGLLHRSVEEPLKKFGAELSTSMDIMIDAYKKKLFGGMEQVIPGGGPSTMLESRGALTGIIEKMRGASGIGDFLSEFTNSAIAEQLFGKTQGSNRLTAQGYAEGGIGAKKSDKDYTTFARRAEQWARPGGTLESLGFSSDAENSDEFRKVEEEVTKLLTGNGKLSTNELKELRKNSKNEAHYLRSVIAMGLSDEGQSALQKLASEKGASEEDLQTKMSSLFVHAAKKRGVENWEAMPRLEQIADVTADLKRGGVSKTRLEAIKKSNESVAKIISDSVGTNTVLGAYGKMARTMGFTVAATTAGTGVGFLAGMAGAALGAGMVAISERGKTAFKKDLEEALSNESWGQDLKDFITSGKDFDENNRFFQAATVGKDPKAQAILQQLNQLRQESPDQWNVMRGLVGTASVLGLLETSEAHLDRMKEASGTELLALDKLGEKVIGGDIRSRYSSVLRKYKERDVSAGEDALQLAKDIRGDEKAISQLMKTGGGVAGAIAGRALVTGLVEGRGVRTGSELRKRISQASEGLGFDVMSFLSDDERSQIKEMEKDGLTRREQMSIERMLEGAVDKGTKEGAGKKKETDPTSPQGKEEKLYGTLENFALNSAKFAEHVGSAISGTKPAADPVVKSANDIKSQTGSQVQSEPGS